MASDRELERHVVRVERRHGGEVGGSASEELDEYRAVAGEIHDELARRIERLDDDAVDEEAFAAVLERLDRLESRLDDLEARL